MCKKRRRGQSTHVNGTEPYLERLFLSIWLSNFPNHKPLTQLQFHPTIQWKFDFAWPMRKLAVEVQGMGPGHVGLIAMTRDYNKHRAAMIHGWKVVYLTKNHLLPEKSEDVCFDIARLMGLNPQTPSGYIPLHKRDR